uniref:Uncharacterized protein n=1 Tax=Anguilla anguilla TaxID=7936 RepID=A0A0E9XWZ0_ANGAN
MEGEIFRALEVTSNSQALGSASHCATCGISCNSL